ncbi:hypothetical protein Tco_1517555 [Tanacetum coccineum]
MAAWGTQSRDIWDGGVAMSTCYGQMVRNPADKGGSAEAVVVPKFDMPLHQSLISSKDVKNLTRKYNILLDLHPCTPTEGWTMDQLPEEHIGLTLADKVIDLRPVHPGLLFAARLLTTWDFPGSLPIFKDTEGNGSFHSGQSSDRLEYHSSPPDGGTHPGKNRSPEGGGGGGSEGRNVEEGESSRQAAAYVLEWAIPRRCRVDTPEWCRELMVHLAPLAA